MILQPGGVYLIPKHVAKNLSKVKLDQSKWRNCKSYICFMDDRKRSKDYSHHFHIFLGGKNYYLSESTGYNTIPKRYGKICNPDKVMLLSLAAKPI